MGMLKYSLVSLVFFIIKNTTLSIKKFSMTNRHLTDVSAKWLSLFHPLQKIDENSFDILPSCGVEM